MLKSSLKYALPIAAACLWASVASATAITCGSVQRTATLDSATSCLTGVSANPGTAQINALFGGSWSLIDNDGGATDPDNYFTVGLTTGTWTSTNATGTWAIDPAFWTHYGNAVIAIHVGEGAGDPDYFAWSITNNATSGTWAYNRLSGGGGGLSNFRLFASGPGHVVPEPTSLGLLAAGLLGLGFARRRAAK